MFFCFSPDSQPHLYVHKYPNWKPKFCFKIIAFAIIAFFNPKLLLANICYNHDAIVMPVIMS